MTGMDSWKVVALASNTTSENERLFFSAHEWDTIEAASARIIPTDYDPGAREANVVRFIDRYISGIGYIFAAADGSGFLELSGRYADVWRARVRELQNIYVTGARRLDGLARGHAGVDFVHLGENDQDLVLEALSGAPKPQPLSLSHWRHGSGTALVYGFDDRLDFFRTLVAHTTQGFYSDPIYGGNRDYQGWAVIGFPGPKSLKDTTDGTFSVKAYFESEYDWADLIPQLKEPAFLDSGNHHIEY